jgi:hypothetical protein
VSTCMCAPWPDNSGGTTPRHVCEAAVAITLPFVRGLPEGSLDRTHRQRKHPPPCTDDSVQRAVWAVGILLKHGVYSCRRVAHLSSTCS